MLYRPTNSPDPKSVDVDSLHGATLQTEVKHLAEQIAEHNKGVDAPLLTESLVIGVHGVWGAGKTHTSHAFINYLHTLDGFSKDDKFHLFHFALLPFGNINESIGSILGEIGRRLWEEGVADVRKGLRRLAIDATPAQEFSAGFSLFGLSISRKLNFGNDDSNYRQDLRDKFSILCGKGHRFVIMLDDLDRMKPDEVVAITRLIDSFQSIPGFIFVLPYNKEVVAGSITEALVLSEASSRVFLRKFIKASLNIRLTVEDLKRSFTEGEFGYGKYAGLNSRVYSRFGMNTDELAWYILLHTIIVRETISVFREEPDGNTMNAHYKNSRASVYLASLFEYLYKAKRPNIDQNRSVSSLPYETDGKWKRFADVYLWLTEEGNARGTLDSLNDLLNEDMLTNDIYTSPDIIEELRSSAEVEFDAVRAKRFDKRTVFEVVILPIIKKSTEEPRLTNEPKLTQNYSRRDMQQLANAIHRDPKFMIDGNPKKFLKNLITITKERFEEFR